MAAHPPLLGCPVVRQLGQAGLAKEGSLGPQFRNTNTVPFWGPRGERFCIWIVGGHSWVQDTGPPWLWPRILAVSLPYLHSHSHKSSSEPTTFFISPCKPGLCDPGPLPWSEMGNYETLCVQHLIFISSLLKIFLRWKQETVYTYVCGSKIKILIDSLEGVACFWPHFKCQFTRKWKVLVTSVMSDSLRPRGLESARLLSHWNYSGKNIGVGCHALLQGIFPTQGLNPGLPHCRQILYHLSHQGSQFTKIGRNLWPMAIHTTVIWIF